MKKLFTILAIVLFASQMSAQVEAELNIENRTVSGSDFYFDIFLKTTGSSSGDLYLSNADFVLSFSDGDFSNPTFEKESGTCTLVPTDGSGSNTQETQTLYFDNTATTISGNEIIVNLNGPAPVDQSSFDTRVAKVEGAASTHRLGTFKITGLTNPNTNGGLAWKTLGDGVLSRVYSHAPSGSFVSTEVNLIATDPDNSCGDGPPLLVVTPSSPAATTFQAQNELSTSGAVTVLDGTARTYKAGTSVTLNADFEVELGGELEALIEACDPLQGNGEEQ